MRVSDVIATIRGELDGGASEAAAEGLIAGKPDQVVRQVLVCQSPSVSIIRKASAEAGTLLISREHPYYVHDESPWSVGVDAQLASAQDAVLIGKRGLIEAGDMALYRLSSVWDAAHPHAPATALASALGYRGRGVPAQRSVICAIRPQPIAELARSVRDRLATGHVRVIGPLENTIRRVAVLPSFVSIDEARGIASASPAIDAVICGESCEWEGAAYFKDTADMGRHFNVILAGTQPTQEPGVQAMFQWLRKRLAGLPVSYAAARRPVRHAQVQA